MPFEPTVKSNSLVTAAKDFATGLQLKEQKFTADYESRKRGIVSMSNVVRFGAMFAICAVVGPIAYMAIKGIVGLAAFGVLAFTGYHAAPVIALKVTNAKELALEAERNAFYRALDAERNAHINKVSQAAALDPIATAKSQSLAYKQRAAKTMEAITAYNTEVKNFESLTVEFGTKYPANAQMYKEQLAKMKEALENKSTKYKALMETIRQMDDQIAFLDANWKMSQALQKANALGGVESVDPMEQIKADSAIDAVRNSVNKAFAEMESAVLQSSVAKTGTPYDRTGLVANAPSPSLPVNNGQQIENVPKSLS